MFGRLFDNPMVVIMILLVIVLLFGAPKLPGMARSLGQSMRIFKSEVKEMKDDDKDRTVVNGESVETTAGETRTGTNGSTSTSTNGSAPAADPAVRNDPDGTVR
ncbi:MULTISPECIES: Sec-independent protein translocase subunit TatA [Kocuria]|uniref:Sec-independent protein translocase protein TatA n=1 Tax=Kocuria subflava TaxID=1736139 RepID=A0A846TVT7_9MICC|nr:MULTISPECIES: Sec-independent protein translocase subunit TatA [Kocuria]NKE09814.1 Sec-independent protein translocase subunit TatA [Kocuria subflava]